MEDFPQKKHTTKTTNYWIESNGILVSRVKKGAVIELPEAIENKEMRDKLIGNNPRPILIDIRKIKNITGEARVYTQKSGTIDVLVAVAILVGSPLTKIIGSFALGFNKPTVPTKLFLSENAAVNWLLEQYRYNE